MSFEANRARLATVIDRTLDLAGARRLLHALRVAMASSTVFAKLAVEGDTLRIARADLADLLGLAAARVMVLEAAKRQAVAQ